MKLSIAWIFDHIDADWKKINIADLVAKFNQTTAEIEGFYPIKVDLNPFSFAQVKEIHDDYAIVQSHEWGKEHKLALRKGIAQDQFYLIKKIEGGHTWATGQDFYGDKDALLPAFEVNAEMQNGSWKKDFEVEDYIIELDNKSVTHRPDMWGHRGFAREVAVILDLPLKPLDQFLVHKPIKHHENEALPTSTNPFTIKIEAKELVKSFAGIYFDLIAWRPSQLPIASRLIRVDGRPIDALVDMTNYVMFDLGQPMHAFDAMEINDKKMIVRLSHEKEPITLLDGEKAELTVHDIVVSDDQKPLGLAGVMGGKNTGVKKETTAILLESACFDATTIRRTAARYKKRSEASARFEKSLDPKQPAIAIERFLYLLNNSGIPYHASEEIFDLGPEIRPTKISVTHEFIEKRLGAKLDSKYIVKILEKLDFKVDQLLDEYIITVPSFRATKDIKIKEDIVEEIGRIYGYVNLQAHLPAMHLKAADIDWVYKARGIKENLAYGLQMRELYTYAFFDEEFLAHLKWQPGITPSVQNPVSENWRRLVTTLIPALLKAVVSNSNEHDRLRFFESARVWHQRGPDGVDEKKSIAGIFYDKKHSVDFYEAKAELQKLWDSLKLDVIWHKIEQPEFPWYAPFQTARLEHNGIEVGIAGKMRPNFLSSLCMGDAFMFELNGDFLLHHKDEIKQFVPISKYPEMVRDISMLISEKITVADVIERIKAIDPKIMDVSLVDFFEKPEWPEKKSMTFRFIISDHTRTLLKEEADEIWDKVAAMLKDLGATIR